jgi:hypothetical protein
MAQVQATLAQLQAKLATVHTANVNLTNQVNTLQATMATTAAAPTAPMMVAFALMPATSNLMGLLDYSGKLGGQIYKEGCKKLTDNEGFAMTPVTTAAFVKCLPTGATSWAGARVPRESPFSPTPLELMWTS